MKFILIATIFTLFSNATFAHEEPQIDTLVAVDQVNVSTIKQGLNLYRQPIAATILSNATVESKGITAIKDVSQIVPNLHIPEYGSRTTSSIYVRGLGARIDQPVMGLNIDNVPLLNKNGFDTEVMDIERIEVLRGPQSTLYGRNTMGGIINIYTLSPFNYQGVRVGAEYSSGNTYKLQTSIYNKHSDKFATAISLYHNSTDGLFVNSYNGELCDWEKSVGGRLKLSYRGAKNLRIENTTSSTIIEQGGYPYRLIDSDEVNYNEPSSYDRLTINNGTTVKYQSDNYSIASITSYQYIDDDMRFDNDFTEMDYFALQQAIKEHSVTEDIVFKTENDSPYNALFGAFGFYKNQNMNAPVTFRKYGIDNLILAYPNKYFAPYYFECSTPEFLLGSKFSNQTYGAAIYHESEYVKERWSVSASIRFDYEHAALNYHNINDSQFDFLNKNGELSGDPVIIKIDNSDSSSLDFFEILPRIDATYKFGKFEQSTLYTSISKGYKAGGFNTQMFSDILQQRIMTEFGNQLGLHFETGATYDTDEIICYKPEHSWNFEIGSHIESQNRKFSTDIALFYINCQDQQLTVFPAGETTGRMMTNAGKSRSFGAEISAHAQLIENLQFNGSYGYTNAKFTKYISGTNDYSGNFVPYAPQHTLFAELNYTYPLNFKWLERAIFNINTSSIGPIYWNEDNSRSQSAYSLLGASIRFEQPKYAVTFWAKNILQTQYNTFYFMSMSREFVQSGRPQTIGVKLTINI